MALWPAGYTARVLATSRRHKAETFEPVALGHIRSHGCRDLLVYCDSGRCHHSAMMNADWLPDKTPVRSLCPRMVCTRCGLIGAPTFGRIGRRTSTSDVYVEMPLLLRPLPPGLIIPCLPTRCFPRLAIPIRFETDREVGENCKASMHAEQEVERSRD